MCYVIDIVQPELVEQLLLPPLQDYHKHHPGVGSFVLVAAQVMPN